MKILLSTFTSFLKFDVGEVRKALILEDNEYYS